MPPANKTEGEIAVGYPLIKYQKYVDPAEGTSRAWWQEV